MTRRDLIGAFVDSLQTTFPIDTADAPVRNDDIVAVMMRCSAVARRLWRTPEGSTDGQLHPAQD